MLLRPIQHEAGWVAAFACLFSGPQAAQAQDVVWHHAWRLAGSRSQAPHGMQGWDSLQAGIDGAVRDEKSLPLFQKAFDKFQEVSASGQIQMGNVKLALGKRHIDCAIIAGEQACMPPWQSCRLPAASACSWHSPDLMQHHLPDGGRTGEGCPWYRPPEGPMQQSGAHSPQKLCTVGTCQAGRKAVWGCCASVKKACEDITPAFAAEWVWPPLSG